jgi:hypothetical protein
MVIFRGLKFESDAEIGQNSRLWMNRLTMIMGLCKHFFYGKEILEPNALTPGMACVNFPKIIRA